MSLPSGMTSEQRRERIRDLLIEELSDGEDAAYSANDVVTTWVALVGVHSFDPDDDDEFGWVAKVAAHPDPPTWMVDGLVERYRLHELARYTAIAVHQGGQS